MKGKTIDDYMYITFLITFVLLILAIAFYKIFESSIQIPICFFWEHWNVYCPGCGCTRAFEALLHCNILQSIYYNPSVLYFLIMVISYLVTQSFDRLLHHTSYIMPYSNVYIYVGIILLIANCILRNILLLCFHIPLS